MNGKLAIDSSSPYLLPTYPPNMTSDGLGISVRAMQTESQIMKTHSENIANFGVPGYQAKRSVVSFKQYIDPSLPDAVRHPVLSPTVDTAIDASVGRMRKSNLPLDAALNTKGYFQKIDDNGTVELTRDGRFNLDADGWVRALDGRRVLSAAGVPLRFTTLPKDPEKEIKISRNGDVQLFSPETGKVTPVGRLGIVNQYGSPSEQVEVRQGYVEDSNVMLQDEYVAFMPIRREFEANRQMFIIQNDNLTKMIQELGRTQ
jgi:flagellar basal body rod protein FlgG